MLTSGSATPGDSGGTHSPCSPRPDTTDVRRCLSPDRLLMPVLWFMVTRVLTVKTPFGRAVKGKFRHRGIPLARVRRKDLAAAGVERVPRTEGVRDGQPQLEDGRVLDVANVIWCTGF